MKHQPLNAEAVRDLAAAKGIDSTAELARRSGMDRSLLNRVLRGARPAQPSHVLALADALDVEPAALLEDVPA